MDFQLIWTESSREDLKQVIGFVASGNRNAAEKLGNRFIESVERMARFPRIGRVVPEYGDENLRELVMAPYRIIYEIEEARKTIYLLRLWHSARGHPIIVTINNQSD